METEELKQDRVLHLALQDGFEDDLVVVQVDGREVFRGNVQTDYRISLAESREVPVREGDVQVEVHLPQRGVADTFQLKPAGPVHLGISYLEGALRFRTSAQPFGYV